MSFLQNSSRNCENRKSCVDEHGGEVGRGEGLGALEGPHGHVGGDGRTQDVEGYELRSLSLDMSHPTYARFSELQM